ncbi:MAG: hypothetical protein ACRES4_00620 [Nevskiales bacterium]
MKGFLIGLVVATVLGLGGAVFYLVNKDKATQPAAYAPAAAPAASMSEAPLTTSTPAPEAAPAPAGQPLARTDHEAATGISLAVTELKRTSGDTVMLKFTMTNSGTTINYYMSKQHEIELVDAVNKKKYLVVKDSEGKCLCTAGSTDYVKPGSQVSVWAKFPAPPPDVTKISVVIPNFIPMDDVPISQ